MWWFAQGVPPEVAGLPTWALNGLSIGSLVMLIIVGLVTSKLWTKSQVDNVISRYEKSIEDLKQRYETHLQRTVALYEGRVNDSLQREKEWREIALQWQATVDRLTDGVEGIQEHSATSLAILQSWQVESRQRREL
jgi:amino acid permease